MPGPNYLRGFVFAYWGSVEALSNDIGVQRNTVYTWLDTSPRNMLKYLPEMVQTEKATAKEVMDAVMERCQQLGRES